MYVADKVAYAVAFLFTYVAVYVASAVLVLIVLGWLVAGGFTGPRATKALNSPFTDTLHWVITHWEYWAAHGVVCVLISIGILYWDHRRRQQDRDAGLRALEIINRQD